MTTPAPIADEVLAEIVATRQPLGIVCLGDRYVLVGGDSPCDVRVADLARELIAARGALRGLLRATERARKVGCLDHTDCWDTAETEWWEPHRVARSLLPTPRVTP